MTDDELLREIDAQRSLMAAVATGGPRIDDVNTPLLSVVDAKESAKNDLTMLGRFAF